MQFIITGASLARSRAVHLSGTKLVLAFAAASLALMLAAAGMYHWVFLKGAREGWPVFGALVKLVTKDEFEQRDRFMRENLDAMARRLGEMQAKLVQMEALGERVSGLAGLSPSDVRRTPGRGGALVSGRPLSLEELQAALAEFERTAGVRVDVLTVIESRLLDQKIRSMMIPTQPPLGNAPMGSMFGWRIDPFTGRQALHTGLDFQAATGTSIFAASGGVVVAQEMHPAYGNMVEIDHGNGIVTRYAHTSRAFVKQGDLVKRGQKVAEVGTTGRSTGPHLHFEVLVGGVPQDPRKFLDAGTRPMGGTPVAAAALPVPAPAPAPAVPASMAGRAGR